MNETFELAISAELAGKIGEHGAETYPHECCGALLGRDPDLGSGPFQNHQALETRQVLALFPLVNRRDDSPRNRFSVTAEDVQQAEKYAATQGLDIIGWYHSHPDHPARPSQYDREHAWPWYSYVIVGIQNGQSKDLTSWRLNEDRSDFLEEKIQQWKESFAR